MSANQEIITSCFQDIISIKGGCGDIASTSGLYANQIDITPDFINEIINRTYSSPTQFFQEKRDFAITNVVNEVIAFLAPKIRVGTLLNDFRAGQFQDNLKMIAGDGNLKGINIDLWNAESFLNLFVNEISLQVDKTGDVDVLVYDLVQNKLLDTIKIACVADEISTIFPAKEYVSSRRKLNLAFVYDSTGISANTTYLTSGGNCRSCSGSGNRIRNSFETIYGVKVASAAQKIKSNLKLSNETGGLSIVHSLQCNHRQWLCSYSNMLALPILYKLGELILEFALTVSPNDRVNTTVTLNRDELNGRLAFYSSKYQESLHNIINNIKTPDDRHCFECRESARHAISHQ